MPEILVATPLHHSVVSQPYTFPDGLSIRKLPPILWDKATVKRWVSEDDQKYMNEDRYWLCADKEVEYILGGMPQDLYEKAMHAALALQIIAPTGAKHVFMEFAITPEGLDNLGASHAKQLCSSRLSRLYHAESPENVASARSVHLPVEAHGGASLTMLAGSSPTSHALAPAHFVKPACQFSAIVIGVGTTSAGRFNRKRCPSSVG